MKLGIKTTDGVSKLKTKITDGVTRAVECACCKCDPYALWGPGYDTKPETVEVLGNTITRTGSCRWSLIECVCGTVGESTYIEWMPWCDEQRECSQFDFAIYLSGSYLRYNMPDVYGEYIRTGGEHPFPYGIYTLEQYRYFHPDTPPTITISPP